MIHSRTPPQSHCLILVLKSERPISSQPHCLILVSKSESSISYKRDRRRKTSHTHTTNKGHLAAVGATHAAHTMKAVESDVRVVQIRHLSSSSTNDGLLAGTTEGMGRFLIGSRRRGRYGFLPRSQKPEPPLLCPRFQKCPPTPHARATESFST